MCAASRIAAEESLTSHEELLAEIEELRSELESTFENAPLGITSVDLAGRFIWVNDAFADMLGYERGELQGQSIDSVTHADDVAETQRVLADLVDGSSKRWSRIKRFVAKDGRVVNAELHALVVPGPGGKPKRLLGLVLDITQRLEAEEEVRQTRERLAHVARMSTLGQMATGIAHEINQPLAAVATYAHACARMIRSRMTNDVELLETLDRISDEALRAGAIINRLRDLVRRRDSRHAKCDLNELVRDIAGLAGLDAFHSGIRLELDLADALPQVVADRIQVQQVILNLVRNAMEAMEADSGEDRAVTLRTLRGDNGAVEVAIIDRGVGLTGDEEAELFEPFYTTKEAGMGMGLSISRSIVRAHGGRVWFTRNADRGTTFHFTLPAEDDPVNASRL